MNILYFGDDTFGSTSLHRAQALQRLGHEVIIKNPYRAFKRSLNRKLTGFLHFHTGYRMLQCRVKNWMQPIVEENKSPDIIWVNGGELFGKSCLAIFKRMGCPVVLYNNDDPTGNRDGRRFDSLLKALSQYDLCAVCRKENVREYNEAGVKNVMRVWMSYDEVVHRPFENPSAIPEHYQSEVSFIGTWMRGEGRDEFMLKLAEAGLPVNIWGGRWEKSPHWPHLKEYYRGGALSDRDYTAVLQGAKICIGLLSKGNRDLHTRRSVEIPYAGGLLCAERTPEHREFYEEGREAVFWDDAQECAEKCRELLKDDHRRERIRRAGMKRVRELHVGNEDICQKILHEAAKL